MHEPLHSSAQLLRQGAATEPITGGRYVRERGHGGRRASGQHLEAPSEMGSG